MFRYIGYLINNSNNKTSITNTDLDKNNLDFKLANIIHVPYIYNSVPITCVKRSLSQMTYITISLQYNITNMQIILFKDKYSIKPTHSHNI